MSLADFVKLLVVWVKGDRAGKHRSVPEGYVPEQVDIFKAKKKQLKYRAAFQSKIKRC